MRVLLSTYGSRGGVTPLVALAVRLPVRPLVHGATVAATLLLDAVSRIP
ncbi:MAG: hypothetical protein ACRDTU_08720 [Micromonosporaceae bacterium]